MMGLGSPPLSVYDLRTGSAWVKRRSGTCPTRGQLARHTPHRLLGVTTLSVRDAPASPSPARIHTLRVSALMLLPHSMRSSLINTSVGRWSVRDCDLSETASPLGCGTE